MTFFLVTFTVFCFLIVLLLNWDWIESFAMFVGEEIEWIRECIARNGTDAVVVGAATRVLLPALILSIIIGAGITL